MDKNKRGGEEAGNKAGVNEAGDGVGTSEAGDIVVATNLCTLCGITGNDDYGLEKHITKTHFILGGGDSNLSTVTESSEESEEDFTDDEKVVSTNIYTEHEWGNEDTISEPPIGKKHEI